ncbi:MAG TPA: hypothetical protein VFE96_09850 [Candidatus Bathyarchaeia archaeon]|nr:hypothetical protein [Candidatus Bathyarchaeia archaeon]
MSEDAEPVIGVIPVNARLEIGFEQLQLIVTSQRIIVVHKAKRGRGGLASIMVLGRHSGDFVDPDKPKSPLGTWIGNERVNVRRTLASNKDNFAVGFSEIVSVRVDEGRDSTTIEMVTGNDKFQFFTKLGPEEVSEMFSQHLGPKLVTRKKAG